MGMFLPETPSSTSGGSPFTPSSPEVTQGDIALMQRVLRAAAQSPNLIPDEFMAYTLDWLQTQNLEIPIGQVFGFSGFTMRLARVQASESATGSINTYQDLATVGPELDGLPDGRYQLLYGATIQGSGSNLYYSPKLNSTEATDADALILTPSTVPIGGAFGTQTVFTNGTNTILMRYKYPGGGQAFSNRWLVAIKYANV